MYNAYKYYPVSQIHKHVNMKCIHTLASSSAEDNALFIKHLPNKMSIMKTSNLINQKNPFQIKQPHLTVNCICTSFCAAFLILC